MTERKRSSENRLKEHDEDRKVLRQMTAEEVVLPASACLSSCQSHLAHHRRRPPLLMAAPCPFLHLLPPEAEQSPPLLSLFPSECGVRCLNFFRFIFASLYTTSSLSGVFPSFLPNHQSPVTIPPVPNPFYLLVVWE